MAFILESRLQESEVSNSSGRMKQTPRGHPGSHSLSTCAYYLSHSEPLFPLLRNSHPVLRCRVRIACMSSEPSLKAAKHRMIIL